MARTYQRNVENLEKRAQAEDKKVTDLSVKLGKSARELATAEEKSHAGEIARLTSPTAEQTFASVPSQRGGEAGRPVSGGTVTWHAAPTKPSCQVNPA
jgi:S-methylmethionine-dependent homocysteine/selenocysteine methylase